MTPKQQVLRKHPHARSFYVRVFPEADAPRWCIIDPDTGRGLSALHHTPRQAWRGAAETTSSRRRRENRRAQRRPAPPALQTAFLFE